jgi:hypothetical protein
MKKTRQSRFKSLLVVVASFALARLAIVPSARADSIAFSNGGPNQHGGNEMTDFLQSDVFTLSGTTEIIGVNFWDLEGSAGDYKGSVYWAIQQNAGSQPGAIIASGVTSSVIRTATGLFDTSGFFAEVEDQFGINPIFLTPGTYWMTLHDGPTSLTSFSDFYWEWSHDTGSGQEYDLIANAGWDSNGAAHAFLLTTVPEPASLVLVALGLGMFASWSRFSRRSRM